VNRLIGGKVVAFDMRTPGRIYMRCPECAAENNPPVVEGGPT
jgi:cell division protein FtsQ